ncbi:hypothetical protein YC2023_089448 [Brassica napus]
MLQIHSLQTPTLLSGLSSLSALKISNVAVLPGQAKLHVYTVVLRRLTRNLKSKLSPGPSEITPLSSSLFMQCTINVARVTSLLTITTCFAEKSAEANDVVARMIRNEISIKIKF